MKNKDKQLDPLCAAVKRIREASGMSQERFGREINVALATISRFENGRQVPSDPDVLTALHNTAARLRLESERELLAGVLTDRGRDKIQVTPELSPVIWRLTLAARAALLLDPEKRMAAIKEAVGEEALSLVDEVLWGTNPIAMLTAPDFWTEKEKEVTAKANQRALERLTRRPE